MVNYVLERRSAPGSPNQPGTRQDRSFLGFYSPGGRLERHPPKAWKLLLDGTLHDRAETVRRYLAGHVRRFDLPEGYAERWTVLDDLGYHSKPEVFP